MGSRTALLALLTTVVVVASWAGIHSTAVASVGSSPDSGFATDAVPLPSGATAVELPSGVPIDLTFSLSIPRAGALSAFLASVENPRSPDYRQFLTHAQFESRFAPAPSEAEAVASALAGAGAHSISIAPDRLSVSATLPAGSVDQLFGVQLLGFASGGQEFYTAIGTPTLPPSVSGLVDAVDGLSNAASARLSYDLSSGRLLKVPPGSGPNEFAVDNNTGQQWFVGSDYANALEAVDLWPGNPGSIANASYPTGVAIATILASGYNTTLGENTPPWDPAVVTAYFNDTLAPTWPRSNVTGVPVTIAGSTPPLPGSFGAVNDSTLDAFENSLDLEMAGSLAAGAPIYNFYFSGSLIAGTPSDSDIASFFDQDLAAALSYNYGSAGLGVVSGSFGIMDLNDSLWDHELEEAASMGVTVVMASGDQGDAPNDLSGRGDGQWPVWPASAAFNTSGSISVGGASLTMGGVQNGWFNGTDLSIGYDANTTGISALTTWWDTSGGTGSYAGSEGGASVVYPEPYWQLHSAAQPNIRNATILQGASSLGRAGPDLALPANRTIAYVTADTSGNIYFTVLEGTSVAAPSFAGLIADEIAVAHHAFGYLDPELYRIESYYGANPGPTNPLYDIVNGSNYVFSAGPGWDATTGWGTPLAPLLYAADANATIRNFVYTGPTPGLPTPTPGPPVPWTEVLIIIGVGIVVAIVLVLTVARSGRPAGLEPPPPPFGAPMPPPAAGGPPVSAFPSAPGSVVTFLCPYCGSPRPAEAGRCPRCGAF
jgi:pseudomonalisin